MQRIIDLAVRYIARLAEFDINGVGIQDNIANAGMVGMDFFNKYILPYEKQLVDAIKSRGKFTIYHNCGKTRVLRRSYADMGLASWETVADKPQGDNQLAKAKQEVGDKLVLIGNID